MTEKQIADWKVERDIARKSGDPELMQIAYDHRDDMMMECIQHQADRIKQSLVNDERIEERLDGAADRMVQIERELPKLKEAATEFHDMKIEARGMKRLWDILKILVSAGGGALLLKVLGG